MSKRLKNVLCRYRDNMLKVAYLFLSAVLFLYDKRIIGGEISSSADLFLIVYFIVISLCVIFRNPFTRYCTSSVKNRGVIIGAAFLAVWMSFSLVGNRTLFANFSWKGMLVIFLTAVWCFPVLFLINDIKQIIARKVRSRTAENGANNAHLGLIVFFIVFVIWLVLYIGIWPGAIPYDGNLEIAMAYGLKPLSSWQPFIHVYLVKLFSAVFGHVSAFFVFQIVLGAALISNMLLYSYKKSNCSKWIIILVATFLAISPGLFSTPMILLRDYLFSAGFAWLLFLLLIYRYDKENGKGYYVQLFLSLFLTSSIRSNGILPLIAFVAIAVYIFIHNTDRKLLGAAIAVAVLVVCINGPVTEMLHVEEEHRISFSTMPAIDAFMAVKHYGGKLPVEVEELMKTVTLQENEDWASGYNENQFVLRYDISSISTAKILYLYVKTFFDNPHLVIWNRLSKTSVLWEIVGHGEGMIKRYFFVDFINEGSGYPDCLYPLEETPMTPITRWVYSMSSYFGLDFLNFRSGIYVIFLANSIIFAESKQRKRKLIAMVPVIVNFLGMLYAIGYHEGRYVYWLMFCWIASFVYDVFILPEGSE